jgi:hypothetical protein
MSLTNDYQARAESAEAKLAQCEEKADRDYSTVMTKLIDAEAAHAKALEDVKRLEAHEELRRKARIELYLTDNTEADRDRARAVLLRSPAPTLTPPGSGKEHK